MVNVNVIPCQSIGGCSAAPVIAIYHVSNGKICGLVGVLQGKDLPLQQSSVVIDDANGAQLLVPACASGRWNFKFMVGMAKGKGAFVLLALPLRLC